MPQADSPPLAAARWRKVEELYEAALVLPVAERSGFLARECAGDAALQREVASLLAHDNRNSTDTLLDHALTLAMEALTAENSTRRFDMALLNAGDIVGNRYRILDALDAGGIGEVYLAEDTTLGKQVVVKVLKKASQDHPWFVKKFRDEAAAQAKVNHPNVASVLDKGKLATGEDYLVVEFIAGVTLRRLLKERDNRQMEFAETAEVMRQTGRAVTAIHDCKLIHRDLKPENLMIQTDATHDEWRVKVIDFGIVRVHGQSTVLGQIAGTLHYMSPEQLTGRDVTPASDVYALGVIAYEMLTGRQPHNPENPAHLLKLQEAGVKLMPTVLRDALPKAAEAVLLKALSYDAAKRYDSARAFGDALAQALTPQPLPPQPDKRWRAAAAVASVLAVCLLAALWWNFASQTPAREQVIDNLIANSTNAPSIPASGPASAPANGPVYDAEAAFPTGKPPQGMVYATIGFTVWRTRPATARDGSDAARETIDSQEMAAERIADTIADGERIYLGIESLTGAFLPDKGGYLYVINREQYADGTLDRARLIFPTLRTYAGANRVKPGQPIVLPETNRPFVIRRSSPAQVAESYTVILSPWQFQLPEPLGEKAMTLPDNLVADWEKQYGGRVQRATLRGGVGQVRTMREFAVGSRGTFDTAESLTTNDPLPQTSFRRTVKNGNPAMVTVALRFKD